VIHAVGPRWGEGDEESKLRAAVRASLDQARELGISSLALPAISTGIFGYPKAEGTKTIVNQVLSWLDANPDSTLTRIRLAAFDTATAELFAEALR
jgi:O-acetyl-ADP-ribose deacetylase (regulator of RNase III)